MSKQATNRLSQFHVEIENGLTGERLEACEAALKAFVKKLPNAEKLGRANLNDLVSDLYQEMDFFMEMEKFMKHEFLRNFEKTSKGLH